MGVLIDTNVLINWERQRSTLTLENLRSYFPIHVSAVSVGELYTGVYRSTSDQHRVEREPYFKALFNMMQVVHHNAIQLHSVQHNITSSAPAIVASGSD